MNSIEFPEMNYNHFREKNAKFHILVLLSIMGGISLIIIYDRKFRYNRPEEGLPKMITYISPINMVVKDNHLYFAYKSPLGTLMAANCPRRSWQNINITITKIFISFNFILNLIHHWIDVQYGNIDSFHPCILLNCWKKIGKMLVFRILLFIVKTFHNWVNCPF